MAKKASSKVVPIYPLKTDENTDEEWILPSSDTLGHNVRVQTRMPPRYARLIQQIIQKGIFPYRTDSDLVRHGIHRHLGDLSRYDLRVPSVMGQLALMNEMVRDAEYRAAQNGFFEECVQKVSKLVAEGHTEEARRLDRLLRGAIEGMPRGYWRSKYEERYEQQVAPLMPERK